MVICGMRFSLFTIFNIIACQNGFVCFGYVFYLRREKIPEISPFKLFSSKFRKSIELSTFVCYYFNISKKTIAVSGMREIEVDMRIVLCEDQKILLDGLASTLVKDDALEIVAAVPCADEILPALRANEADIVLSDIITTENKNFLEFVKDIKAEFPSVRIMAITGFPDITFMEHAKKVGVDSFVYKNISTEELISVLKNTYAGYSVYPTNDRIKNMMLSSLTDMEFKILRMYCNGKERDEIASTLYLSKSSIKAYISSILQKTGFSSIARVAIYAVSTGMIFTDND